MARSSGVLPTRRPPNMFEYGYERGQGRALEAPMLQLTLPGFDEDGLGGLAVAHIKGDCRIDAVRLAMPHQLAKPPLR